MSAHPFGPDAVTDCGQLYHFREAVEVYAMARLRLQSYETAKTERPEAFTMVDMAELNARHVAESEASNMLIAHALILKGSGVLDRLIGMLEGGS